MRVIGIVTSLMLLAAAPAAAVEPEAFLERLEAAYAFMGYDLDFGSARTEGDAIVVDGVTVAVLQPEGQSGPVNLDTKLRFEGVAETEDGTYTAEMLNVGRIALEHDTGFEHLAFTADDLRMGGFYLPPGDVRAVDSIVLFSDLESGPVRVSLDGMEVFSLEAVRATSSFNPPPGAGELIDLSSHLVLDGMALRVGPEKTIAKTSLAIFGAATLHGRIEATVTWSMDSGLISVEPLRLAFDEQGALEVAFTFDGLTPDVLQMIYESERRASEMRSKGKTQSAEEIEMRAGLGLLEKLYFVSASVRYEDGTLVGRLLTHLARQEGRETAAYTGDLLDQLSLTFTNARAPGLAESVVRQVRRFLADPGSIQIAVAPVSPLRFITVASAAVSPAGLANMLGLSVTANGGG